MTLRRLLSILRNRRGSVTIEFAVVGPMTIAAIVAILHNALLFLAQQGLQTAAEGAGRLVMTGRAQTYAGSGYTGMTGADFKNAICGNLAGYPALLPPFLTCSNLYVDVSTANTFSAAVTGAPTFTYDANGNVTNGFGFTPGGAGPGVLAPGATSQVVVVKLMYLWPVQTAPFGFNVSNTTGSKRMIYASTVLVTESYQ